MRTIETKEDLLKTISDFRDYLKTDTIIVIDRKDALRAYEVLSKVIG